jgi:hypothetical protein
MGCKCCWPPRTHVGDHSPPIDKAEKLGATVCSEDQALVKGECGHPMQAGDWADGWRVCRNCPQDSPVLFDAEREPQR